MPNRAPIPRTRARQRSRLFRRCWDIALVEGHKLMQSSDYKEGNWSGAQFRTELKRILDRIFELPPIAEEISDIVISVVVDSVAWRIRETDSKWALVRRDWIVYAKECIDYCESQREERGMTS